MWLVMIVRPWYSIEGQVCAIPVQMASPPNHSIGFIEAFAFRDDALREAKWRCRAGG